MKVPKIKIALGFNIYLEHQLHYEKMEEKGRVKIPPRVQLGGGAWNMAKSFENLASGTSPVVVAMSSMKESPESAAVEFLLERELSISKLLPLKERMPSSFYLMPRNGKTWAGVDQGVPSSPAGRGVLKICNALLIPISLPCSFLREVFLASGMPSR